MEYENKVRNNTWMIEIIIIDIKYDANIAIIITKKLYRNFNNLRIVLYYLHFEKKIEWKREDYKKY